MNEDLENYILDSSETEEIYARLEIYNETVINLMAILCHHQCKYHSSVDHQVNHCTAIANKIEEAIDNGYIFSDECMDKFVDYINYQHNYWYTMYGCIKENSQLLAKVFNKLFVNYIPTVNQIKILLTCPEYDECLVNLVEKNKKFTKFNIQTLEDFAITRMKHSENKVDERVIIDTILNNCDLTDTVYLNYIIEARNSYYNDIVANLLYKYNRTLDQDYMSVACEFLPYTKNVIDVLLFRGLKLDNNSLEIACQYADAESLKFIINLAKIPLNNEHYYKICCSKDHFWVEYRIKVIQDKYNKINNKVDDNGYRNASSNLIIIKIKSVINDNYYQYNKVDNGFLLTLHNMCRYSPLYDIKSFVEKGVVPDFTCIELACKRRYIDSGLITYLISVMNKYQAVEEK